MTVKICFSTFLQDEIFEVKQRGQRHIIDEFQRVALLHHQVRFEFYSNDTILFQLEPKNLRQRIVQVFGKNTNEKLNLCKSPTDILKVKRIYF